MRNQKLIRLEHGICKINVLGVTLLFLLFSLAGCGERNLREGGLLGAAMVEHLSKQGICHTSRQCSDKFNWTSEHENGVRWNIYDSSDRKAVAKLISFVVEHGIEITGGVSITINVYAKLRPKDPIIFIKPNTIMKIEVTA